MFVELTLLCATLVFILFFIKYESNQKRLVGFKGRAGIPLVGNAFDFLSGNVAERLIPYFTNLVNECGERCKLVMGLSVTLILANADDTEKILGSSLHIDKGEEYRVLYEWLGFGLLTSSGEKWHFRRKLLTPAFHYKILESFVPIINEHANILVSILKEKNNQPREIQHELSLAALDVICETAMGRKVDAQLQSNSPYIRAVNESASLIISRNLKPWLTPDFTWKLSREGKKASECIKVMSQFTDKIIEVKKLEKVMQQNYKIAQQNCQDGELSAQNDLGPKKKLAFLDLLLQMQDDQPTALTSKDIIDDVATFMFAGHDTTSSSLQWTILRLGHHPEVQKKAQQEIDSIFGHDKTRPITLDDLKRMEYLELVIKETLRLHPPVPLVARKITSPLKLDDEVTIPPNTPVWIFIQNLHQNPKYWESPQEFLPERFTLQNSKGRHPYAYIPFSAGARNCIGRKFANMTQKIILAQLIRTFHITSTLRIEDIHGSFEIVVVPKEGVNVTLTIRHT